MENIELKLAVLIDAENISFSKFNSIMEEINNFGIPIIKRVYADWTNYHISGWHSILLENALIPVQQYNYASGKNSTDSSIIIDAMDILYGKLVDGFCIVSSDSDFTRLVMRLREGGMKVFGFGEKKTPRSLIKACDKFTYIEILEDKKDKIEKKAVENTRDDNSVELIDLILGGIEYLTSDDDDWVNLARLGVFISKNQPDFDVRNYGFKKLSQLIDDIELLETKTTSEDGLKKVVYVKIKEPQKYKSGIKKLKTTNQDGG